MGDKRTTESVRPSTKGNVSFTGNRQSLKLQDQASVRMLGKSTDKNSNGRASHAFCSVQFDISTNNNGQRQLKQEERVPELIKHMSRVPSYLQHFEKDDTSQRKALTMGVIDWGHLQKWKDSHRPVMKQENVDPSGMCAPSSSKIHGTSSVYVRKSLPDTRRHREPHREDLVQVGCKKASRSFSSFLNLSPTSHSVGQPELHAGYPQSKGEIKHCAHQVKNSTSNSSSGSRCNSQEFGSFHSVSSKESEETLHSDKPDMCFPGLPAYDSEQISHDRPLTSVCMAADHAGGDGQCIDGTQIVEDSRNWSDRFSFGSAGSENPAAVLNCEDFSGRLLSEDLHYTAKYSDIPHSCPFPLYSRGNELIERLEPERKIISNPLTPPPGLKYSNLHADCKDSRYECSKNNQVMGDDGMGPCHAIIGRSCPNEVTSLKQLNMLEHLGKSKAADLASSKSRSPLRKVLDTLLKLRVSYRHPGTVTGSPANIVRRLSFAGKTAPKEHSQVRRSQEVPPETLVSFATCMDRRSMSSALASNSQGGEPQGPKHGISKRQQALMRLAWKDQLPVFTFTMNNSDVLVAARKRTAFPNKYDSRCCYTIYNLSEARKSIGARVSQGSKQKEFVSRAVGKMFYSCRLSHGSDGKNSALERQFVLIGPELKPTAVPKLQLVRSSELAAFIIRLPESTVNNSAPDTQGVDDSIDSCNRTSSTDFPAATDKTPHDPSCCDTIAILPSEVHGWSDSGEPSPLIERWKSGGLCDCGGWDAGCFLTILSGNLHNCKNKEVQQPALTTNAALHAKLFVQGASRESMPIFRLRQITEGLYEVEFEPSIATLQAFSLCVAVLHCQMPESLPPQIPSFLQQVDAGNSHMRNSARSHAEALPASYLPHRPPLSPVGRA